VGATGVFFEGERSAGSIAEACGVLLEGVGPKRTVVSARRVVCERAIAKACIVDASIVLKHTVTPGSVAQGITGKRTRVARRLCQYIGASASTAGVITQRQAEWLCPKQPHSWQDRQYPSKNQRAESFHWIAPPL
jgi:hypothetical protein